MFCLVNISELVTVKDVLAAVNLSRGRSERFRIYLFIQIKTLLLNNID